MTLVDPAIANYDDIVEIGRGSSSVVYQARQRSFDRPVAIKVLPASQAPGGRRRFKDECEAVGRLSGHPGIVTVYDAGAADDGTCYLVMELLTGGSLAELLAGKERLDVPDVLRIGVALAGALESAHRVGVVHGDVKPENVLLSRFGDPKLADFGLVGMTLAHAAPERLTGADLTPATDVYALASTLHTLLAGHPPFVDAVEPSMAALAVRITTDPPEDLRSLDVPESLCLVLEQGMAKDPALRQATAEQLGRQLQAVQARLGLPISVMVVENDGLPVAPAEPAPRPRRRVLTMRRLVSAALVLTALLGGIVSMPRGTTVRLTQLYTDDFSAGGGWHQQDSEIATVRYDGGEYVLQVRGSRQQFLSDTAFRGPVYQSMTRLGDVSVQVTARPTSGTGLFGIVCRQAVGRSAFYEGLIGVDGTARIVKYDGDLVTLASAGVGFIGQGEPVRLRLDCAGGPDTTRLRLFLGPRAVVDVVDRRALPPGSTGLALATADADHAIVAFDDVVIRGHQSDMG